MNYQLGIVGGGLAGLSLAIQASRAGISTVLFEKKEFPFHKLCGEYLSRESLPFLESLGFDYKLMVPAEIDKLRMTNVSGKQLTVDLPLGGIGLSRYTMDNELMKIAKTHGAMILENTSVQSSQYIDNVHYIKTKAGDYQCEILVSAFGKQSNLSGKNKLEDDQGNNYLGIKYHARLPNYPEELISIHNFKDGYCGVCRLEKDWVSICYLSHTQNLRASNNSIAQMEDEILFQNSEIAAVFEHADMLYQKPIAVSNIAFKKKALVHEKIIYVGDAAGLITPLCGNGMSMALHGSYILGQLIQQYFNNQISDADLYLEYDKSWNHHFSKRMAVGRSIQSAFRKEKTADIGISLLNIFPFLNKRIISLTHGKNFYKG
ncbi:NAD(P)/FAD-dependent oxidoreductase [Portibacter lacus]|uniref:FAD-dependent oxidoreductase n=1 Tax=Portibacter lacus TaxID=1099794 RepID=A0AA37STN6_9BACT|nr:NAD(P)/FAD-dependent oxidoreductase [Portibacter lacus]GLR19982.1 FAD-dependent oxidoreductase [Portibacter lacus]